MAAASVGWVMVGCTALGFGVGAWLDKKFGTSFWMPLLTFVGIAAGFREMIVTLGQVSRQQAPRRTEVAKPSPSTSSGAAVKGQSEFRAEADEEVAEAPQARLFKIPPPPFMEQPKDFGQQELSAAEVARRLTQGSRRLYGDVAEDEEGGEKSDAV